MRTPLLVVTAVAGLVAGCSNHAPTTTTPRTVVAPVLSAAANPVKAAVNAGGTTPQGFLHRRLGEDIALGAIRFSVIGIDTLTECVAFGRPAPAGKKSVVLRVSMTTGGLDDSLVHDARLLFSDNTLKAIAPDGQVTDVRAGACGDLADLLSDDVLPNTVHEGTVEVVVPETATAIASSRDTTVDGARGWAWEISG